MALTKDERAVIDDIKESQNTMMAVLLGANGDDGLVGKVNDVCDSHYALKNKIYLGTGILIGLGILGGGGFGIFQLISG